MRRCGLRCCPDFLQNAFSEGGKKKGKGKGKQTVGGGGSKAVAKLAAKQAQDEAEAADKLQKRLEAACLESHLLLQK